MFGACSAIKSSKSRENLRFCAYNLC